LDGSDRVDTHVGSDIIEESSTRLLTRLQRLMIRCAALFYGVEQIDKKPNRYAGRQQCAHLGLGAGCRALRITYRGTRTSASSISIGAFWPVGAFVTRVAMLSEAYSTFRNGPTAFLEGCIATEPCFLDTEASVERLIVLSTPFTFCTCINRRF